MLTKKNEELPSIYAIPLQEPVPVKQRLSLAMNPIRQISWNGLSRLANHRVNAGRRPQQPRRKQWHFLSFFPWTFFSTQYWSIFPPGWQINMSSLVICRENIRIRDSCSFSRTLPFFYDRILFFRYKSLFLPFLALQRTSLLVSCRLASILSSQSRVPEAFFPLSFNCLYKDYWIHFLFTPLPDVCEQWNDWRSVVVCGVNKRAVRWVCDMWSVCENYEIAIFSV